MMAYGGCGAAQFGASLVPLQLFVPAGAEERISLK
jgi:hypothetical protein